MQKHLVPKEPSYEDSGERRECELSPQTEQQLGLALDYFLGEFTPEKSLRDGDFSFSSHWIDTPYQGKMVHLAVNTLRHDDVVGVLQYTYFHMELYDGRPGPGAVSAFEFNISDIATDTTGDTYTFETDDNGKVISGFDRRYNFIDSEAVRSRQEELINDPEFQELSGDGVSLPKMEITTSGEIYEDGTELATHSNPMPELSISSSFFFSNPDDELEHRRRMAAYRRAAREIGSELTEERAQLVIDVLAGALQEKGSGI